MQPKLPYATALAVQSGQWAALTPDGELLSGPLADASALPANAPVMLCHAPFVATRVALNVPTIDVLELFAFVKPARFCVPTIGGLAQALGHPIPQSAEDAAMLLPTLAGELLVHLQTGTPESARPQIIALAEAMGQQGQGWGWSQWIIEALGSTYDPNKITRSRDVLAAWETLPEWADEAPPTPASSYGITGEEARDHLRDLVTRRRGFGRAGEGRTAQENYTTRIIPAFAPREQEGEPNVVTAEAGTGVGKTLGYLAPAHLWAERNEGTVWVATYTRNLQRQIDSELEILYPNAEERARKAVIRKGRENYLCLLNFDDLVAATQTARDPRTVIAAGIMARWVAATKDGDLTGNDFPGWLEGLLKFEHTTGLADRRGECIYAACAHYKKCYIERAQRKANRAHIVVANHALALSTLAQAEAGDTLPTRYIFDEGHHLFDAADSMFGIHLTGLEGAELRRWILGPEDGSGPRRARRAKGLKKRMEGLVLETDDTAKLIEQAVMAARVLPAPNWKRNFNSDTPQGPIEAFLQAIYHQVKAHAKDAQSSWSLECDIHPLNPDVIVKADECVSALKNLHRPLFALSRNLREKLDTDADLMNAETRMRLGSLATGLERRATRVVAAWIAMLENLREETPPAFIDWFAIERNDGRDYDVGYYRHYLDPAIPFGTELRPHAHGVLVTSATLKSSRADDERAWMEADRMTGMEALSPLAPVRVGIQSPFKYAEQTRVLVVNDIRKDDIARMTKAYGSLFKASHGGALGLFTAIHRLRMVHEKLAPALEAQNIPIYAQHIDNIGIGTLVDIFRAEEDACLLGTDAVRDGVDVPGRSLRLIVFDRVPWPRPTIMHRARKQAMGGKSYEESLTRMKLRQAYGRLVRSPTDHGVFVLLDSGFPSRLEDSFPEGVAVQRVPLDEAIHITRSFFTRPEEQEKVA
ncbi:MAG: ATP-dependent DNA helicase [Alphaproteobacteria bacterium]|nr:ATP-dependent DNA helicase [Alphaproteobacteria bacterium]